MKSFLPPSALLALCLLPAVTAPAQEPSSAPLGPESATQRLMQRMDQAKLEYDEAVAQTLSRIDDSFGEAKTGASRFAEAVLGAQGKAEYAYSVAEQAGDGLRGFITDLFGADPFGDDSEDWRYDADHFTRYVRGQFEEHVLDTDELEAACQAALEDCAARIDALENQILVELQADLPDIDRSPVIAPVEAVAGGLIAARLTSLSREAIDAATADITASLGRFAFSFLVGNLIADEVTPDDASDLERLSYNIGAGMATDQAIDRAMELAGHDPQGALAARVEAALDGLKAQLLDGNEEAGEFYGAMLQAAAFYPAAEVRSACREAATAMEHGAALGLGTRLRAMSTQRQASLLIALIELAEGPLAPEQRYLDLEAFGDITPKEIIDTARFITSALTPAGE